MPDIKSITAPAVRYILIDNGYRVGDDGSVWTCLERGGPGRTWIATGAWRQMVPVANRKGYLSVKLRGGAARKVYRLVLEAFIGPRPEGLQCRHLDGNPANNRLENLCWGTPTENSTDALQHDTIVILRQD